MANHATCIFCLGPVEAGTGSHEHVLSEALGVNLALARDCAHRACNNALGHDIEAEFIQGLDLFRWSYRVRNGRGRLPEPEWTALNGKGVAGKKIKWGEVAPKLPRQLVIGEDPGKTKDFRVYGGDEAWESLRKSMQARHPNGQWEMRARGRDTIDFTKDDIFAFLDRPGTYRCVAKYAYNFYVHCMGPELAAGAAFDGIREYIATGRVSKDVRPAFVIAPDEVVQKLPSSPPNHVAMIVADPRARMVIGIVGLFGLFPFYVVLSDQYHRGLGWWRAHAFDPVRRIDYDLRLIMRSVVPRLPLNEILVRGSSPGLDEIGYAKMRAMFFYNNSDHLGSPIGCEPIQTSRQREA